MELREQNFEIKNSLENESTEFQIAANAKMFDILSNKIYEDPIRAIVRELSCNAIDAHIDGNNIEPIEILLPTNDDLTFIVRDFGIGMTHEDVMTVYRSYGKSTKSSSNKVIGALGLGGKTPLAYTQQFTLSTCKDGTKNDYIIFRNEEGIPEVSLVNTGKSNASGTEVEIIVKYEDMLKFHRAAIKSFLFFDQMPNIVRGAEEFYTVVKNDFSARYNTEEPIESIYSTARDLVKSNFVPNSTLASKVVEKIFASFNTKFGVIMGQVFYSVNENQITDPEFKEYTKHALMFPNTNIYDTVKLVHVGIGDVSIQPSREVLNYNKRTIEILQELFYKDFNDYVTLIKDNYGTPELFLDNIENIPYLKIFEKVVDYSGNEAVGFLKTLWTNTINHFFTKAKLNKFFFASERVKSSNYQISEIERQDKTAYTDRTSYVSLFQDIFLNGTHKSFINVDEIKIKDSIEKFWSKRKSGKRVVSAPIALSRKLKMLSGNRSDFIISFTHNKYLTTVGKLVEVKSSSLKLPVEPKTRNANGTPREVGGTVWSKQAGKYITLAEFLKKLNGKKVYTYEVFEGVPGSRGWFHEPIWANIGNKRFSKNEDSVVERKGSYLNDGYDIIRNTFGRSEMQSLGLKANMPDDHFLFNWKFFKKNEIWNFEDNGLVFYKKFLNDEMIRFVGELQNNIPVPVVHGKSWFGNVNSASSLLKMGTQKFGNKFVLTVFGTEAARYVAEKQTTEILAKDYSFISRIVDHHGSFFENTKKEVAKMLEEIGTQKNPNPVDYTEMFLEKYPLMRYLANASLSEIIDYIGLVEK